MINIFTRPLISTFLTIYTKALSHHVITTMLLNFNCRKITPVLCGKHENNKCYSNKVLLSCINLKQLNCYAEVQMYMFESLTPLFKQIEFLLDISFKS